MKLNDLLTLWPPFGGDEDTSPDPAHYHKIEGPQIQYHSLEGSQVKNHDLEGAN